MLPENEKPSYYHLMECIHQSILTPLPSSKVPPSRPRSILIQHRWGEEVFNQLMEGIQNNDDDKGGIDFKFQSNEEAIEEGKESNTDPEGKHFQIGESIEEVNLPSYADFIEKLSNEMGMGSV